MKIVLVAAGKIPPVSLPALHNIRVEINLTIERPAVHTRTVKSMRFKKKQREIHPIELEIEELHQAKYQKMMEIISKKTTSSMSAPPSFGIFSIHDAREYTAHPRLAPLISEEEAFILPNKHRFLNVEDSSDEKEDLENEEDINKMLFIPLKGEKQISLSQSTTETESSIESSDLTSFEKKRKKPRPALGVLTNRQVNERSRHHHRIIEEEI